jgi:predicted ATPase
MVLSEKELQVDALRYNMDLVDEYQSEVFHRQLLEEAKYSSFVSDRSAIDTLAYAGQHSRILPKLLREPQLDPYLASLRASDAIIFFVRPTKATLSQDGVRESITFEGVVAIDAQIKLLYEMYGIRYFQVSADSMQERVKLIESVLSLCSG